ncbi:hypothetical protein ACS8YF_17185 [Salinisphaera sp. SWV1]|uniref:hypothetical protein n=1 Tax=Salinisphaera sp. SWV1 TaxID=3454139 RepID=UPI003F82FD81
MATNDSETENRVSGFRRLVDAGAEISGGAIGSALGFIAGGPGGAATGGAGGAAAAAALKYIGGEISERVLSQRERVRVGGVLALVASDIHARIEAGETIRNDGFFEPNSNGRSDADEVAESVLLKAQREAEEDKLPYMAHLLSSIAFDSSLNTYLAHQLIKAAEQLTFRQLCLLRIGAMQNQFPLRSSDYNGHNAFTRDVLQVVYECYDLYAQGFVSFGGTAALGPIDVNPGGMEPQGIGAELHNLMRLWEIPMSRLQPIAQKLK